MRYLVSLCRDDALRGPSSLLIFVFRPHDTDILSRSRMIDVNDIRTIVLDYLEGQEDSGFFLAHTEVRGANEIVVEIDHDTDPIDLDTIVSLTRWIEERMDREQEDFELMVSSAGLTSPLRMPRQYRKYVGKEMVMVLKSGAKEQGILTAADDEKCVIEVTRMVKGEGDRRKKAVQESITLPYPEIKSAVYDLKV